MCKSRFAPSPTVVFYPHVFPDKPTFFPENQGKSLLSSSLPCGFHRKRGKPRYFLLLMLVVISFTFSAKAGSVRICFSTLSSECMMVE